VLKDSTVPQEHDGLDFNALLDDRDVKSKI
jgi:hypothetical protein